MRNVRWFLYWLILTVINLGNILILISTDGADFTNLAKVGIAFSVLGLIFSVPAAIYYSLPKDEVL